MTKFKFDFSNMSAADFVSLTEVSLDLVKLRATSMVTQGLFGEQAAMPEMGLDAIAILLRMVQIAARFTDGYTLQQVPYNQLQQFLNDFSEAWNSHTGTVR